MKRLFRRLNRPRLVPLLLLAALVVLVLTGCETDTPQNTFDARGEVAKDQRDLFYLAMWPAIVIMIGVLGAAVVILLRFRRREGDPMPKQVHGNTGLELTWTILPAILLLIIGVPTVAAISKVGRAPSDDSFRINVTGQRFLWEFSYPEVTGPDGEPVSTVDEVFVPVGREVGIYLNSIDVIHSFWVPKLAGKLDAVPGRENVMWMRADEPGSFSGQCAEFCGLDHANMRFVMTALEEDDFEAWQEEVTAGE